MKSFREKGWSRNLLGIKWRITSLRNFREIVFWAWSTRNELAESGRICISATRFRGGRGFRLHHGGRISGKGEIRPDSSGISPRKSIGMEEESYSILDRISYAEWLWCNSFPPPIPSFLLFFNLAEPLNFTSLFRIGIIPPPPRITQSGKKEFLADFFVQIFQLIIQIGERGKFLNPQSWV